MLTIYLMCLLVGGVLVALSLVAGGDLDADAADVDVEADGEGLAEAARFLSLRNVTFGATFFGLTGLLLTVLSFAPRLTALTAAAIGVVALVLVQKLMDGLRRSESGAPVPLETLVGSLADVVVGFSGASRGKISVDAGDTVQQLVARRHERAHAERFTPGERVVVVKIDEGEALVAEESFVSGR